MYPQANIPDGKEDNQENKPSIWPQVQSF